MNVFSYLFDPAHWTGTQGIPVRLLEHIFYTALTLVIALVIAVPIGAWIGHTGRGGFLVVGAANGLRALPTLGLLVLIVGATGLGLLGPITALVILAVPPILAGTYAGVRNVDPAVVDAARGMGMRGREVLLGVELPNALPLIIGGIRSSTLQVISTATIAAYVALGGLGRFIIDGLAIRDFPQMIAGSMLVALLAVTADLLLAGLQKLVVSPGLRAAPAAPAACCPLEDPRRRTRGVTTGGTSPMRTSLIARGVAMLAGFALALTACGGGSDPLSSGSGQTSGAAASNNTIVVGSANFVESQILAEIYAQALTAKGVSVEKRLNIGSREAYIPALQDGSIDLIPEYSGVLLQYFDKTADETAPDAVYSALQDALPDNLIVLDKSAAEDKDAVVVTRDTATRLNVKSIADLAPHCRTLVFGGAPGVPDPPRRHPGPPEDLQLHVQGVPRAGRRRPADGRRAEEQRCAGRRPFHHAIHHRGERLRRARRPEEQLRRPERPATDQQGEGDRHRQGDAERDLREADHRGPDTAQRRGRG